MTSILPLGVATRLRLLLEASSMSAEEREQRAAVVKEACAWVNTPYHHRARIKGAGVDCAMILAEVYEQSGFLDARIEPDEYVADWFVHRDEPLYLQTLERYALRVDDPGYLPLPGDIALYRYGRQPAHGAIVIAWPMIVHAYVPARKVVFDDACANKDLESRYVGVWSPWAKRRAN